MPSYAVNLLPLQAQQQQQAPVAPVLNATATTTTTLIDLSRLHNQQPPPATFVSTGLRLSFEDSHPPQRPNQPQQQLPAQGRSFLSSFLTEELAAQVKQQRDEINSYLQSQVSSSSSCFRKRKLEKPRTKLEILEAQNKTRESTVLNDGGFSLGLLRRRSSCGRHLRRAGKGTTGFCWGWRSSRPREGC